MPTSCPPLLIGGLTENGCNMGTKKFGGSITSSPIAHVGLVKSSSLSENLHESVPHCVRCNLSALELCRDVARDGYAGIVCQGIVATTIASALQPQPNAGLAAYVTASQDVNEAIVFSNMKTINRSTSDQYRACESKIQRAQHDVLLRKESKRYIDYQISRSWQIRKNLGLSELRYALLDKYVTRCLTSGVCKLQTVHVALFQQLKY